MSSWLKIIAPTCVTYQHLLRPNAHLLNKLWGPDEVTVLAYEPLEVELPKNFLEHILPNKDPGRLGWGGPIAQYLRTISEPYTCIIWEDVMMTKPFDKSFLNDDTHSFLAKHKVAKLSLVHDHKYAHYVRHVEYFNKCGDIQMYKVRRGASYQLSVVHAIWETQFLIELCDKYVHPWAIEKGKNTNRIVLVPEDKLTDVVTTVMHYSEYGPTRFRDDLLPKHTLQELKDNNMLERWGIV